MDSRRLYRSLILLLCATCPIVGGASPKHWEIPFGTTEPQANALHGKIYSLPEKTRRLPDFETLHARGDVYVYSLWVKNQATFPWHGLPGSEWYAIDYRGVFWLKEPARLKFFLYSDDGSKLYIDDRCIINNDGVHSVHGRGVRIPIPEGLHRIRLSYFQGPAPYIALALFVQLPGQEDKPFDTRDFLPPNGTSAPTLEQRPAVMKH
jgi:hypothetical protein